MNIKERYGTKEFERDYGVLTFGDALSSHRLCQEMSQKEFALKLGISAQSLCDIEKGRTIPTPKRAAKIAKAIGSIEAFWIQLALQDELKKNNLDFEVTVKTKGAA